MGLGAVQLLGRPARRWPRARCPHGGGTGRGGAGRLSWLRRLRAEPREPPAGARLSLTCSRSRAGRSQVGRAGRSQVGRASTCRLLRAAPPGTRWPGPSGAAPRRAICSLPAPGPGLPDGAGGSAGPGWGPDWAPPQSLGRPRQAGKEGAAPAAPRRPSATAPRCRVASPGFLPPPSRFGCRFLLSAAGLGYYSASLGRLLGSPKGRSWHPAPLANGRTPALRAWRPGQPAEPGFGIHDAKFLYSWSSSSRPLLHRTGYQPAGLPQSWMEYITDSRGVKS
ncbi:translation initiation factor IF-2-like [Oxyura jamaicensis]|uniref:translation initiation factor IF-2-like n=1 Tax=Oxyura jamaicensis TaxID=8884 RepID=UPI0015A7229D|nr:translation initiation factor IF-2-like [Oxyura jamaicensis]